MASISGTTGSDTINGTSVGDIIRSYQGRDSIWGAEGNDAIYGGSGVDSLWGDDGADRLSGENGADFLSGGNGNDRLLGGNGNDVLEGSAGNDLLNGGSGHDTMIGGAGNDIYYVDRLGDTIVELPGAGIDRVNSTLSWTLADNLERLMLIGSRDIDGTGNGLANVIRGNAGANRLLGEGGNDELRGGAGSDWIEGGAGRDKMFGGGDADTFVFRDGDFAGLTKSSCDTINDFRQAQGDRIDLQAVDANSLDDGDQEFQFIGTGGFSNVAGELRYEIVSGQTYVYGDTNGDAVADFMFRIKGPHTLTDGDFVI